MKIQSIITIDKLKNFFSSFFLAGVLSALFISICLPFLISVNNFSYLESTSIGQTNLWRIVLGFGVLSVITTIFFLIRKNKHKLLLIFLWVFWLFGIALISLIYYKNGGLELSENIFKIYSLNRENGLVTMVSLPFFMWFFGIYYCREVAKQLNMSTKLATLFGVFFPAISAIAYFYFSFKKKEREQKIEIIKMIAGVIIIISLSYLLG